MLSATQKTVSLRLMQKSWFPVLVFFLILSASCNKAFNKVQKSNDMEYKAQMAQEYFEKKKYDNALALYEELLVYYKGQKNVEQYYFNYAMSHYNKKDYLLAGFYFNQFTINFPRSPKAEEAAFLIADCYHRQSPATPWIKPALLTPSTGTNPSLTVSPTAPVWKMPIRPLMS